MTMHSKSLPKAKPATANADIIISLLCLHNTRGRDRAPPKLAGISLELHQKGYHREFMLDRRDHDTAEMFNVVS